MTLGDLARGRDNNFNLIRAIAATAVLVSHAWPISLGPGTPEPLSAWTGASLGTMSVYVFFAISGFLIAASFDRTRSPRAFLAARGLRLFPGLFVSLVLVAFVMGPLVTTLAPADYLTHPGTLAFVPRNMALVSNVYTLPGVFETNPYATVEGSIWTLVHEVVCYMGVLAIGLLGAFRRPRLMAACLGAYAAGYLAYAGLGLDLHPKITALHRLSLPFALGTLFYVLRHRLPLSIWGVAGLAALAAGLKGTAVAGPALILALAYGTFWLAYVPRGAILGYNRLGDYSYGIYIYAFPLQGLVVWLWGPMAPLTNIALALPLTLALSILSWHLIESPALALRHRLGGRVGGSGPAAGRAPG